VTKLASSNGGGGGISIGKAAQCVVIDATVSITYTWKATFTSDIRSIYSIQQHAAAASEAVSATKTVQGAVATTTTASKFGKIKQ